MSEESQYMECCDQRLQDGKTDHSPAMPLFSFCQIRKYERPWRAPRLGGPRGFSLLSLMDKTALNGVMKHVRLLNVERRHLYTTSVLIVELSNWFFQNNYTVNSKYLC